MRISWTEDPASRSALKVPRQAMLLNGLLVDGAPARIARQAPGLLHGWWLGGVPVGQSCATIADRRGRLNPGQIADQPGGYLENP